MNERLKQAIYSAVYRMLRPLVLTLLKQGVSYAEFSDLARRAYIDAAAEDLALPDRKQSISRVSVLTGINRKEIARLQKEPNPAETGQAADVNRAYRVVNGWLQDDRYQQDGQPATLQIEGDSPSFSDLVRRYSGDVPWRAVLDELLRLGQVERQDNEVQLVTQGYIPQEDLEEKFQIMGRAASDIMATFGHNLSHTPPDTRVQRTVAYTNLPEDVMDIIRQRSKEEAEEFLQKTNKWLSRVDAQNTSDQEPTTSRNYRAGIGLYYFEEALPCAEEKPVKPKRKSTGDKT
ncbi:hypothetical protein BTA51_02680 [Hahella sp. CCB-MM4]|uniref:DUF6502 family protein n=1 Tax=Hahella sp. (strain CCB-MM4) TaxID=1926491 RepID=UPI000B9B971D|nr:DUF6502 family protein [Hahella sp. CCB-MM4]OZG75309.1 hypothetical protein BTA51_02680 [Hahella sp. CCB-MM4]